MDTKINKDELIESLKKYMSNTRNQKLIINDFIVYHRGVSGMTIAFGGNYWFFNSDLVTTTTLNESGLLYIDKTIDLFNDYQDKLDKITSSLNEGESLTYVDLPKTWTQDMINERKKECGLRHDSDDVLSQIFNTPIESFGGTVEANINLEKGFQKKISDKIDNNILIKCMKNRNSKSVVLKLSIDNKNSTLTIRGSGLVKKVSNIMDDIVINFIGGVLNINVKDIRHKGIYSFIFKSNLSEKTITQSVSKQRKQSFYIKVSDNFSKIEKCKGWLDNELDEHSDQTLDKLNKELDNYSKLNIGYFSHRGPTMLFKPEAHETLTAVARDVANKNKLKTNMVILNVKQTNLTIIDKCENTLEVNPSIYQSTHLYFKHKDLEGTINIYRIYSRFIITYNGGVIGRMDVSELNCTIGLEWSVDVDDIIASKLTILTDENLAMFTYKLKSNHLKMTSYVPNATVKYESGVRTIDQQIKTSLFAPYGRVSIVPHFEDLFGCMIKDIPLEDNSIKINVEIKEKDLVITTQTTDDIKSISDIELGTGSMFKSVGLSDSNITFIKKDGIDEIEVLISRYPITSMGSIKKFEFIPTNELLWLNLDKLTNELTERETGEL